MDAFLIPGSWEVLSLFCKLSVYIGVASIAGSSAFLVLYSDGSRRTTTLVIFYCGLGAFIGFQGTGLNFLSQIGQINDAGAGGMFDLAMGKMLIDTQLGDVTLYRLLGFAVVLLSSCYTLFSIQKMNIAPGQLFYRRFFTVNCLAIIILALSFRLIGHVSVLSSIAQFAIAVHVLAFSFWIGALFPLHVLARTANTNLVQNRLKRFGQHSIVLLSLLVLAGGVLLWELMHSWAEFYNSAYGISVVLKLLLVLAILTIAAINKFRLVPGLIGEEGARRFRRSVEIEAAVALLILMVTAYFSTVIGPMQMQH